MITGRARLPSPFYYGDSMDFDDNNAVGLLFLNSLVFMCDKHTERFFLVGVEELECRVFGSHETIMETTEQEWPIDEEVYS
jgi:hypothetical protein